jgi:hypothetical protein
VVVGSSPVIYPKINNLILLSIKRNSTYQNKFLFFLKNHFFFSKLKLNSFVLILFFFFLKLSYYVNNNNNLNLNLINSKNTFSSFFYLGVNLKFQNFKYYAFNSKKMISSFSNIQIIKNFLNLKDESFNKKNLKFLKMSFIYFFKYMKNIINFDLNNNFFYLKNLNFFFFYNLYFFFKFLILNYKINFFFFKPNINNNLNFKKLRSIKKRLKKKNVTGIKPY